MAVRDLAAGEEVTISYLAAASHMGRETRVARLSSQLRFECACTACAVADGLAADSASDDNRATIADLDGGLKAKVGAGLFSEALADVDTALGLLSVEGFAGASVTGRMAMEGFHICGRAALVAVAGGDKAEPALRSRRLEYVSLALVLYSRLFGISSEAALSVRTHFEAAS